MCFALEFLLISPTRQILNESGISTVTFQYDAGYIGSMKISHFTYNLIDSRLHMTWASIRKDCHFRNMHHSHKECSHYKSLSVGLVSEGRMRVVGQLMQQI